jgi:hypothetical protein
MGLKKTKNIQMKILYEFSDKSKPIKPIKIDIQKHSETLKKTKWICSNNNEQAIRIKAVNHLDNKKQGTKIKSQRTIISKQAKQKSLERTLWQGIYHFGINVNKNLHQLGGSILNHSVSTGTWAWRVRPEPIKICKGAYLTTLKPELQTDHNALRKK